MTPRPSAADPSLPLADLQWAVARCDAYEAAWRAGGRPAIEPLLSDCAPPRRPELLRRLLALEIELRGHAGNRPTPAEYLVRFPADAAVIGEVFAQSRPAAATRAAGDTPLTTDERLPAVPGYDVLGRVGRGGMGVVYRAVQRAAGRVVAVKMVRPELLEGGPDARTAVDRFATEARAAAGLTHDHILPVYEVGRAGDRPYFVMPFVEGGTLGKLLSAGPLAPRRAAELLTAVARAVQHAHDRGVLHRDLKPGNILVTPDGRPYVTDFGVARVAAADLGLTETDGLVGTPAYLPPEVVAGGGAERYTPAGDVYALGATLYEALTGRSAFGPAELFELCRRIKEDDPPAPSAVVPGLDRRLEAICLKCLRKSVRGRYATAGDLADDLDRYLAGEPVLARPPGWAERAWRWGRRRRVWVPAAVAVAGAVAVAAGARPPGWDDWRYARATAFVPVALDAGRAAEVIGATEPAYRWRAGGGEVRWAAGELTVTCHELSLLELVPAPGHDTYELTASLRQEQCLNTFATAGVYVGHSAFVTAAGPQHAFVRADFADLGPMALEQRDAAGRPCSQARLGLVVCGRTADSPVRLVEALAAGRPYPPPDPYSPPGPQRRITVTVDRDRVTVRCDAAAAAATIDAGRRADGLRRAKLTTHPDLRDAPPLWRPAGGLGVYVYGCRVTVSGFAVRPPTKS